MKRLFIIIHLLVFVLAMTAQERTVTGVVMDGDLADEPLVGLRFP